MQDKTENDIEEHHNFEADIRSEWWHSSTEARSQNPSVPNVTRFHVKWLF